MRAYLRAVMALAGKDALLERKSLETVTATASFTLLVAVLFHFAFDIRSAEGARFFPGALWIAILFAGTIGHGRLGVVDQVEGRSPRARPCTLCRPQCLLHWGKFLFHLALILLVEAVAVPVFIAAFVLRGIALPQLLVLGLFLGTWGFVSLGTLLAGATGSERGTGLLLPVVLFPLLTPVALGGVSIVTAAITGEVTAATGSWLRLLLVFDVLFTVVPALFYESILEV